VTLERLAKMLDAYGGDPDRWPAAERAAALDLAGRSGEARTLVRRAARLDEILDTLPPAAPPSAALRARVVASVPTARRRPAWASVAAPLAAAAVLLVWLTRTPAPTSTPTPPRIAVPMATLGTYETPTDSLLALDELDVAGGAPALRCPDSGLGCPEIQLDAEPTLTRNSRRMHA
jgi:hypothetical protein